jgi:hypothetical protein
MTELLASLEVAGGSGLAAFDRLIAADHDVVIEGRDSAVPAAKVDGRRASLLCLRAPLVTSDAADHGEDCAGGGEYSLPVHSLGPIFYSTSDMRRA